MKSQDQITLDKFRRVEKPIPNQYIVVFNDGVADKDIDLLTTNLASIQRSGKVQATYRHSIKGFSIHDIPEAAAIAISRDPRVDFVEENAVGQTANTQPIGGPPVAAYDAWHLDRLDQYYLCESRVEISNKESTIYRRHLGKNPKAVYKSFDFNTDNFQLLIRITNASSFDSVTGSTILSSGVWYHVVGQWSGLTLKVYVNGVLDGSKSSTFAPGTGTSPVYIGRAATSSIYFSGLIDEVRVTANPLYNSNFTPQNRVTGIAETKGLWRFDGQNAQDCADMNNGSLIGSTAFSTTVP
ncbi:MAG: protease inhibitor I9 family protein [Acidobacteria bacterium]|nr:protease inhibitor I9 family protein [Acidobacteriota bacterium]